MSDYYEFLRKQIPNHIQPRNTPGDPTPVNYGQKEQYTEENDKIEPTPDELHALQVIVGQYSWCSKQIAHDMLPHTAILSTH